MTGGELSKQLPDYLRDEFVVHRELLDAAPSVADALCPIIRFLLRVQSVAARAALRASASSIRPVAEIALCNEKSYYLYYLQLKACEVLKFAREILDAVDDICIFVRDGGNAIQGRDRAYMVWQTVQTRFAHWHNSELPWLCDITDFSDLLARFATRSPAATASVRLANMVGEFYSRKESVDILGPEDDPAVERPLRDIILDLWHHVGFRKEDRTVVDYGAGFGRTRHFFYRTAEKAGHGVAAVATALNYCLVDRESVAPHMKGRSTFPNGPHNDCHYPECPCFPFSGSDMLFLIDPSRPNTVTSAYTLCDSDMWCSASTGHTLPRSHRLVLVKVLHEVPMHALPVLLVNLLHIVPVGGVVFLYELQQIKSVEDDYVVWYPEDIRSLFRDLDFAVACFTGRTYNQTRQLGYCYSSASMLRIKEQSLCRPAIERLVRKLYERRLENLRRRIDITADRLRGRLVTDATRVEHFHAAYSLVNAYRQANPQGSRAC